MTTVHAVSAYSAAAASTRVRLYDWFGHLGITPVRHDYRGAKDNRPTSLARNGMTTLRAEKALHRLDLTGERVIMSREASPLGDGRLEARLLREAEHGVYDFDDALFEDAVGIRRLFRRRERCRSAVEAADVVIAGNDFLADWASAHSRHVTTIPSCVEPTDYQPKTDWELDPERPQIIWLGSPSTETYVASIAPALLRVHAETGAELTVISGRDTNPELASLNGMLRRVPWTQATFAAELARADVAIAPLSDTPFARGKCAYKLLQYAASALPMVGSPVGANALALERFSGVAATTEVEWVDALIDVCRSDGHTRATLGADGLQGVRAHYTFTVWADVWLDAVGLEPRG